MVKIEDELKFAILQMPEKEKDKLLLRLIAKDYMLVAKLNHQLLENEADTQQQRQKILENIQKVIGSENSRYSYDTAGLLMMGMRDCNGDISRHVKITKDKIGELSLTLFLVNSAFENYPNMLKDQAHKAGSFAEYVIKKADFILKKLEKIHEDYHIEFEEEINKMLRFIADYQACNIEVKGVNRLPKIWKK